MSILEVNGVLHSQAGCATISAVWEGRFIQGSTLPRPQRYAQVRRLFWGMGIPMDILVYTPEKFARFQPVPGSFTPTVAREGRGVATVSSL